MQAKKLALMGVFAAVAITLSILENALGGMFNFAVPGVKIGLANIGVILAMEYMGNAGGAVIGAIKACASFLATGAVTVLWFSLGGAALSVLGMALLRRCRRFSWAGVSALGGFLSNLGQLGVMILLSGTKEFIYYLPVLTIFGVGFGFAIGITANLVCRNLRIGRESEQKDHEAP